MAKPDAVELRCHATALIHEAQIYVFQKLISQENDDNTLPVPPAVGSVPVDTAHKLKQEKFITVALEIGELYSGCVYSYKHEYLEDPKQMHIPNWHGIGRLVTNKVSTVVLFDEGMKLHSAGFNAEDEYAELMADSENDDLPWHFFQRFTGFLVGTKVIFCM